MITRIFQMEARYLLRNAVLPVLLGILFLSAAIALAYGRHVSLSQRAMVDSLQADYRQQYTQLYSQLNADTSSAQGKTDHITATHPAVVDFRLHRSVYHRTGAFSLMAIGMSDIAKYYYPVSVKGGYAPAEEKVNNPEQLLSGNFDIAFLFIYLLPLIAICLSYNLLSQEKEQGTLALLVVQKGSVSGILLIRLLMRYLILMGGVTVISISGMLLSGQAFGWQELLAWLGVSGAYTALWMALTWFILSWNASAATNLIALLCSWLVLLVVIPASCQFMLQRSYTDHTANNASLQRSIEWDTWDLPQKQLLDSFYLLYPQYRNQQAYDTGFASSRRAMAYYELAAQRMQRALAADAAEEQRSLRAVSASYYYNPAVYAQALLNSIARTDVRDYDHFRRQAGLFRERWKHFFYRLHFNDQLFTAATYQALPVYEPADDPEGPAQWRKGIGYLLLLTAVWLLAGALVLRKN
jgi:ABC-2 type transport system permease protein